MNHMYRRYHLTTPGERFCMNLRYTYRKNLEVAVKYLVETIMKVICLLGVVLFIPLFAVFFH